MSLAFGAPHCQIPTKYCGYQFAEEKREKDFPLFDKFWQKLCRLGYNHRCRPFQPIYFRVHLSYAPHKFAFSYMSSGNKSAPLNVVSDEMLVMRSMMLSHIKLYLSGYVNLLLLPVVHMLHSVVLRSAFLSTPDKLSQQEFKKTWSLDAVWIDPTTDMKVIDAWVIFTLITLPGQVAKCVPACVCPFNRDPATKIAAPWNTTGCGNATVT